MARRRYRLTLLRTLVVLLILVGLGLLVTRRMLSISREFEAQMRADNWTPASIAEGIRRGDSIIEALERFKTDHSCYPLDLGELIPEYLQKVEEPGAGISSWRYKVSNAGGRFVLSFAADDRNWYPSRYYASDTGRWQADE